MATFHSTDRWFILGIVILVLHFLLASGWYTIRNVLYSQFWTLASIARVIFAILLIILHSRLSSPAILLATTLWNLISLTVLVVASLRTHMHVSNLLNPSQKSTLAFLKVVQHLSWAAILFFATATGCWVRATVIAKRRTSVRRAARALNWTGGGILILCFVISTATSVIIISRSLKKKTIPVPGLLVIYGSLVSAPFMIVRLIMQIVWMRHRNSIGADFGAYIGGGMVMEFTVSFINLLVAWYTFGMVQCDTFVDSRKLQERQRKTMLRGVKFGDGETPLHNTRRGSLVRSAISMASLSTLASFTCNTIRAPNHRTDRPFASKFVIQATGRDYKMDDGNILIRSVRHAYKNLHDSPDSTFKQQPYQLNASSVRVAAQRVLEHVAKLLWLFTLWESPETEDAAQQRALETDIKSIWYEELSTATDSDVPSVHTMRSFSEIYEAVSGAKEKRSVDRMLERVFLHFFYRLSDHDVRTRAGLCLFTLRLMLKQDSTKAQDFHATLTSDEEAEILGFGEDMRQQFNSLATNTTEATPQSSELQLSRE